MVYKGLFVRLEVKPGKEEEVEQFMRGILALVEQEPGIVTWYAFRMGASTFGIFDTFENEESRQAHLNGDVAQALMDKVGELFVHAPAIQSLDIAAAKIPEMEHAHH